MKWRRLARAAGVFVILLLGTWLLLPKPGLLDGVEFSRRVLDRNGELLRIALTNDGKYRVHTPLQEIAPALVEATLAYEDRHFYSHLGISPTATMRCAWNYGTRRGGRAGASTITMQVARLRYRLQSRTPAGKLVQMFRALELERHYTKAQILEAYLNLAPYGGNVEGIGAASLIHLHKSARELTTPEAIALSVIPQNPTKRGPRASGDAGVNAQARVSERLWNTGIPPVRPVGILPAVPAGGQDARHPHGLEGRVPTEFYRLRSDSHPPFIAPHFTTRTLHRSSRERTMRTTLDADLQRVVERQISSYVGSNAHLGIANAASLLVDTRTMEVLAQVGSADFRNKTIHGQVDGTRSRRSPGSALKPFVYALALDQGLIHPLTILKDAPRSFSGYNPENFDRQFLGPIHATEALARSRNLPAVELASRLTDPTLYQFLRRASIRLRRDEATCGLALPLGGAEVTMEELARVYAALANGGVVRDLRTSTADPPQKGQRLLSLEASFLTLEMLGQASRPGGTGPTAGEAIFWKTGTSHGFHDAWTVGVFDHFVLAVWIGNFDGRANPAFIGRTAAAPLFFQIADALRARTHTRPALHVPPPNANLQHVELCAVSGERPSALCKHHVRGWFIPGVSPIGACTIHREIMVDIQTGLRLPNDDGRRPVRHEVYEFWPSDLLAIFRNAGLPRRLPPPFLPEAGMETLARRGRNPRIVSPKAEVVYSIAPRDEKSTALALQADTDTDVTKLYWFADKSFLGATSPREALYWRAAPGRYRIVALDDHGRSHARTVSFAAAETN